ncbi:MAG: hypothetical protein E7182_01295 [Erysipelotrichaceae bacterium]|nr:hypothetical protein [Erysipelotrichaceae bacterium]
MKKRFMLPFIGMLAFSLTACGTKGDTVPQGPQEEQGVPGQNGQDGKDGTSVLTGNGEPAASLGKDGDSYIDLDTWNYYAKENGTWVLKGNIKGSDGEDGQDGTQGDKGDKGDKGDTGEQGPAGKDGADGVDGANGKSAYELAVEKGYQGTLEEWLAALIGEAGKDGANGKSAYELAVENGYQGTLEEWLASLIGEAGEDGVNGKSAYELALENGFEGSLEEWLLSLIGEPGTDGADGSDGKSAYDLAVDSGFEGTLAEWLASLVGEKGEKGDAGEDGTSMLTGNGAPSSELGKDGDSYINLSNWDYYVKENGSWVLKGNIKGADVDVVYHTVAFDSNGGDQTYDSQTIKHGEKVAKPTDPTRFGYDFLNWSYQGEVWSFVGHSVTEDMTLTANWTETKYDLSVTSDDEDKGTVAVNGGGYYMEEITVTANPIGTNVFDGWYSEDEFVSNSNPYTFTMPTNDYSLVAHFITKEEEEARAIKYGTRPILSGDGKTITYGLYPQKNVNDSTLVSALDALTTSESNGWYLYEDEYYAKLSATPYDSSYIFDNGTTIVNGTTYWFKCEPITWKVLSDNDDEYYILSSVLLDAHRYQRYDDNFDHNSNNYENSEIRSFLNKDFYNLAFALGDSHIQTTTVDNSASTTNTSTNPFACNNTQDKVFLPSYQDYLNSSYGFSTSSGKTDTRYCRTTDWARARGAYYNNDNGSYQFNGYYWTRSPYSGYHTADYAWEVGFDGYLNYEAVSSTYFSVRPAISIDIA